MHLIVVRRDMTGFQHLHPRQGADGSWSVPADPARAGRVPGVRRLLRRRRAADAGHRPRGRRRGPARRRCRRRATTVRTDGLEVDQGRRAALHRHARRPPGRGPGLPGRQGPPRRAARGRPRLPPRPSRRAQPALRGHVPHRRAGTACSCSSRSTAACTPPRSPRRSGDERPRRPADHRHDLRLVRQPRRAAAEPARRRDRDGQLRDRARHRRVRPGGRRPRAARRGRRGRRLRGDAAGRRRRAHEHGARGRPAAAPAAHLRPAVAAAAADLDDPGAAVRQLAVAGAEPRDARSSCGAPGRCTARRGRTCATAPPRWTRSSPWACSPRGCGRSTRCSSATPARPA